MYTLSLLFLVLILGCVPTLAQREGNIWYFGEQAGLDFNSGSPVPLLDGVLNTLEGCASIADKHGALLFYTDGRTVWNRKHQIMSNGTGLLSNESATQSAVIVPKPESTSEYYIFTVDRAEVSPRDGLHYSLVDMNTSGDGVVVQKNTALLTTSTEKITAIKHRNGIDVWLLAHELASNVFHAFLVTPAGVQPVSVQSAVGSVYEQGIGYLKASHDGVRLASAVDFNIFEVYNFNNATGQVSTPITLQLSPIHLCYGVEFSPDGKLLYGAKARASLSPFPTEILQFNLEAGTAQAIVNSATFVGAIPSTDATTNLVSSAGALQIGSDNKIYVARESSEYLAVIEKPNVRGAGCNFVLDGVFLGTRLCHYGLPTINQSYYRVPAFLYAGLCLGDSTRFSLSADAFPLDSVLWNFGDPTTVDANTSTSATPTHVFSTAGTYTVSLRLFREGREDEVIREIVIAPLPIAHLGSDTTLCYGSTLVLGTENAGAISYLWSTGETSASIVVNAPGTYWVEASNGSCSNADTIAVDMESIGIDVSAGVTLCRGQSTRLSASSLQELEYKWSPEQGLDDPNAADPTAQPVETTLYTVTATSKRGCTTSATVVVRVDEPFVLNLGGEIAACDGSEVLLDATTTGATYLWSTGETTPTITVSTSGVYSVVVTSGMCTVADVVRVSIEQLALSTGSNHSICQGESIRLAASGAQTYMWSPAESLDDPTLAAPIATPNQTTTYRVVGARGEDCRDTSYITVVVHPAFSLNVGSDTVVCQAPLHPLHADVPDATYLWNTGETSASIMATATGMYWVTVRRGSCVRSDTISLIFSRFTLVASVASALLCQGETVQLQAEGAQSYQWMPSDGLDDPTSPTPMATPLVTTRYTVLGTDANGCTDSREVLVEVAPQHQLAVSLPVLAEQAGASGVSLPLVATTHDTDLPFTIENLEIELRWNASLFQPENTSNGVLSATAIGKERIAILSLGAVTITQPTQTLAVLTGTTLVGDSAATPLRVADIRHESCLVTTTNDGMLTLDACFLEGRSVRYFTPTSLAIMPNPVSSDAYIRVASSEAFGTVGVYNVQGQRVWERSVLFNADANERELVIPAGTLPAGIYQVVLSTTTGVHTAALQIVR